MKRYGVRPSDRLSPLQVAAGPAGGRYRSTAARPERSISGGRMRAAPRCQRIRTSVTKTCYARDESRLEIFVSTFLHRRLGYCYTSLLLSSFIMPSLSILKCVSGRVFPRIPLQHSPGSTGLVFGEIYYT